MPSAKQVCIGATPQAEALLADLLAASIEHLASLPESSTVYLKEFRKPTALTTYRDTKADVGVRIVVQLAVDGWLGSARFWVNGFSLKQGEAPIRLTPEQLYDFH